MIYHEKFDKLLTKGYEVEGDLCIQIKQFMRFGEDKPYLKHLTTLKVSSKEEVESYEKKKMFCAGKRLKEKPDIMTGYNIFGFDYNICVKEQKSQ